MCAMMALCYIKCFGHVGKSLKRGQVLWLGIHPRISRNQSSLGDKITRYGDSHYVHAAPLCGSPGRDELITPQSGNNGT
jgi:hypothetical protein